MKVEEESSKAGLKLNIQKTKIMASSPITGKVLTMTDFLFLGSKITADGENAAMKLKDALLWKKSYDKPRQHIEKQRHHFANKGLHSQNYGFSRSHVWMRELNHKEG